MEFLNISFPLCFLICTLYWMYVIVINVCYYVLFYSLRRLKNIVVVFVWHTILFTCTCWIIFWKFVGTKLSFFADSSLPIHRYLFLEIRWNKIIVFWGFIATHSLLPICWFAVVGSKKVCMLDHIWVKRVCLLVCKLIVVSVFSLLVLLSLIGYLFFGVTIYPNVTCFLSVYLFIVFADSSVLICWFIVVGSKKVCLLDHIWVKRVCLLIFLRYNLSECCLFLSVYLFIHFLDPSRCNIGSEKVRFRYWFVDLSLLDKKRYVCCIIFG